MSCEPACCTRSSSEARTRTRLSVEIVRHDVPAPSNPLGVKGAGEAGTSGVGAALANAVANAVGPAAARQLPMTASRVLAALDGTTPSS